MTQNSVLAIIPARGGSKGIPRKNARFIANRPLISYAIQNAQLSRHIDRVVVSTDDDELVTIAKRYNCEAILRPPELAADDIPLDPVIHHAVRDIESRESRRFDIVITLQPTSPLLSGKTMDRAIERFLDTQSDTLLSVVDDRHLSWTVRNDAYVPAYKERLNRQYLPPNFRETGGIVVSKREFVTQTGRFGPQIDLIEVNEKEAIDIDTRMDWWMAEKLLLRKRIIFRTDGYHQIGLGHIYRSLLLADRLIDHDLLFVTQEKHQLGAEVLKKRHYPVKTIESASDFETLIENWCPDIIINDILDTDPEYVEQLKDKGLFVVNFEDLGKGSHLADLVINALYEEPLPLDNYYCGKHYYCLREEFFLARPKVITESVENIMLSFGGVDTRDYTKRVLNIIEGMALENTHVTIIAGQGYAHKAALEASIPSMKTPVTFMTDIKNISSYMENADIIFTSAGRTVFEIASIGTPVIVMAQNNRELSHTFACRENGIINLGLGVEVSDETIRDTLSRLISDVALRRRCNALMKAHDLRSGIDNVLNLIFTSYEKSEKERASQ